MNNYNYGLLFIALLLGACSVTTREEEPTIEIVNKLQINGIEGEIVLAEMDTYQKLPANKNYKFDITFYTGTTVAVYQPTRYYTGVGSYFNFTLWSQDSTIASGNYIIDGAVNKDFSITRAVAELNVDWSTGESEFGSYLNGTVQVVNAGNKSYKITVNCTDYEGNPVVVFYEGEFVVLEE